MRSLILKEFRQGRPLLIFSVAVSLLIAAGYFAALHVFPADLAIWQSGTLTPTNITVAVLILVAPLVVAIFAGIGLFAGESDHSTVPVLLALPLSRSRIWLGKITGGLLLTAVGTVVIVGLGRLLAPEAYRALPVSPYLPDMCLALMFVFSAAIFMSAVTSYTVAAFVATLIFGGAIGIGLGVLWSNGGAPLLGYNPILDVALWGLLVAPALLFASALAINRGEMLQSLRKHLFGVPALLAGLLVTLLLVGGIARIATRYSRARVEAIDVLSRSSGSSVMALIAHGNPVPYERAPLGFGWRRRGPASVPVAHPEQFSGGEPVYRSRYAVVLDLRSGKELLGVRCAYDDRAFQMAVSPDGRFAAVMAGPDGLTWGVQSWKHFPAKLSVWDLATHRLLFSDIPAPLAKREGPDVGDLKWSYRGDYVAFTTLYSGPGVSGFYAMRRDGSEIRDLAVRPDDWAWSRTDDAIYALDRGRLYRVRLDGKAPTAIWAPDVSAPPAKFTLSGASPDGKWLAATETRMTHPQQGVDISVAAVRAIRTDGTESVVLGSWTPVPRRLHQPEQEDRMVGDVHLSLAWSSDGDSLYALVSVDERTSQLYRWRPGAAGLAAVGPALLYPFSALAAVPGSSEMLIWPTPGWKSPATHGAFIIDASGRTRHIPSEAESLEFANRNEFAGFDDAGRLITLAAAPGRPMVEATDLKTGKSARVYP
jgi:ABC-type transport system involved in multi-copper enzyme maturation permease subunit